jgi:hypothetical protein
MLSLRQRIRDVVAPIIKLSGKLLGRSHDLTPECQAMLREMAIGTPQQSQWNELLAFRDRRFREAFRSDLVTPAKTREETWSLSEIGLASLFTPSEPVRIVDLGASRPNDGQGAPSKFA